MGENDDLHRAKRSAAKTEASNSEEIRELTEKLARAEQALEEKSDKIAGLELKLKQSEQQLNYKTEALSAVERENVALRRYCVLDFIRRASRSRRAPLVPMVQLLFG